jgi:UDP-N-acetylmuramoyl-tripeptide--D-alanyl-D-alanine ligase
MKPISLQQSRQIVGGKALSAIPAAVPDITAICTDTRHIEAGSLFVALRGESHDAHDYLPQAAAGGAIAALVERTPTVELPPNLYLIQVPDTRKALGKLACYVRQQMTAKVIAVAGSNGKTGTKHLIDSILSRRLRGSISPKSFNNDIGVPLAIFPADPRQDYLVLETGTNHHGELRVLTNIALPDIAIITNCSAEHLEGLGDMMGVRREEASIIVGLNPKGLLVVNGDDPKLLEAVSLYPGNRITFGLNTTNDLYATDIRCDFKGVTFRLNGRREVFIPLLGRHVACNALAAIAVARRFGLTEDEIVESLAIAHGPEMRLQLKTAGGVQILNDAYNANPASMQAAIETLCSLETPGRRIAVLGDMRELGDSSDRFHGEIGQFIAKHQLHLHHLFCIGEKANLIAESARKAGFPSDRVTSFANATTACPSILDQFRPGDLVLLKGSRAMRLETIAQAINERFTLKAAS